MAISILVNLENMNLRFLILKKAGNW